MSNHIGEVTRVVVCAACLYHSPIWPMESPIVVLGARHFDERMREQILHLRGNGLDYKSSNWEQGFIDQWGVFMTREEALKVAEDAGQLNVRRYKTNPTNLLFSEDLY